MVIIGSHFQVPNGSIKDLVKEAINADANAIQFFVKSPMYINVKKRKFVDIEKGRDLIIKNNIFICSHAQYIFNFTKDPLPQKVIHSIIEDLVFNDQISGKGTVVHLGSNTNQIMNELEVAAKGIMSVVLEMKKNNVKSKFIIENQTKTGKKMTYSIDQLIKLWHYLTKYDNNISNYVGFCIDTCHLMVNNAYKMNDPSIIMNDVFLPFEKFIGRSNLTCIHFNDCNSLTADRHADLFKGYIGNVNMGGNPESIINIAKYADVNGIPLIIERSNDPTNILKRQHNLIRNILAGGNVEQLIKEYHMI